MDQLFRKIHPSLPLFQIDYKHSFILYTPGYYFGWDHEKSGELDPMLAGNFSTINRSASNEFSMIIEKAERAVQLWNEKMSRPFSADCITIHSGSNCNLNCSYCYSKSSRTENLKLTGFPELKTIKAVLDEIFHLRNSGSKPLTIVFHGSGEPTLHWEELKDAFNLIKEVAATNNTEIFTYIATNGNLDDKKIEWLAKNISLIGISCDGPDDIQKQQRSGNQLDYKPADEVCRKILEYGGKFDIRVTITKNSVTRQEEIVGYLISECLAKNIRVEPAYLSGENEFTEEDADLFFENYKLAKKYASEMGGSYTFSGVRIGEIHGTFCDSLRDNIRLTPDGLTRNCFCFMKDHPDFITGKIDHPSMKYELSGSVNQLKVKNSIIPEDCYQCINVFHCSRGCPDFCINGAENNARLNPFRCRLHQLITVDQLKSMCAEKPI